MTRDPSASVLRPLGLSDVVTGCNIVVKYPITWTDPTYFERSHTISEDAEKLALPFIRATSKLRDELRATISSGVALDPKVKQAVLALSDRIRDYDLTDLGVQLDDRVDGPSLVKFVPASKLIQAREEKAALLAEKARQKEEGKLFQFPFTYFHHVRSMTLTCTFNTARKAKEKAEQEKWEKAKLSPQDMFKSDAKYTEFDADGLPTKLADGNEVPKSQAKKLKKEWEKQKKLHEEYLAKFGSA